MDKQDIDPVSQPKSSHCDRAVACAPENRIHRNNMMMTMLPPTAARITGAVSDHLRRCTHQAQQFRREDASYHA